MKIYNCKKFGFGQRQASALLLAFFMMTLLILVSISVSILVMRDISTVRTISAGVKSTYAAEGATELGLLSMKKNLPGYEEDFADVVLSSSASASLDMTARDDDAKIIPCEAQGNEDSWRALGKNESIQIPLFYQSTLEGETEDIEDFYVDFYVGDADGKPTFLSSVQRIDVLRWKILGLTSNNSTEAMSEYIPLYGSQTSAQNPTVFGTDIPASLPDGYSNGKWFKPGSISEFSIKFNVYSIADFLRGHSYNYLVLTNVINNGSSDLIYFKFHGASTAVCEYAVLESTGLETNAEVRKELVTLVKEGENLPVFDFVLYHTTGEIMELNLTDKPTFDFNSDLLFK